MGALLFIPVSKMRSFLSKILLFGALVVIIDIISGYGYRSLISHAKGGSSFKNCYIADKSEDDIIILGSSKAVHHYNPCIIEDSLRISCYNAGEEGCGIVTSYPRYQMIASRKIPKLVIYEVTPTFDYLKCDEYSKYLGPIRQCLNKKPVADAFSIFGDRFEPVRIKSNMYRNNSSLLVNLIDCFKCDEYAKGFSPLEGHLSPTLNHNKPKVFYDNEIDSLKLDYFDSFIKETQKDGVQLLLMISPRFFKTKNEAVEFAKNFDVIRSMAHQRNTPIIDHSYIEGISNDSTLFNDYVHLNSKGAASYSRCIIPELRSVMQ